MNQQYKDVFLSVMRTAFWKVPLELPVGFRDWKYILKISQSQALISHLADVMLSDSSIAAGLSPKGVERLQDIMMGNMAMHASANNTLILVVNTLRQNGIEPVLLKGQGLASYYPVPQLRSCGDIDLYVGCENYVKAYDVLASIATDIDSRESLQGDGKHFHVFVGKTILEIHRYTEVFNSRSENRIYQEFAADGLSKNLVPVELPHVTVNTPADTYNVYYIFSHLFHHVLSSGVVIRQLYDLACLLHKKSPNVDLERLRDILVRTDVMKPWKIIGCALVDVLGLPQDEFPFYDPSFRAKGVKLVDFILSEEYFIAGNPLARVYERSFLYEKLFSLRCEFRRLFKLMPIFPYRVLRHMISTIIFGSAKAFKELIKKRKAAKR